MDRLGFGYAAVSARRPTMVYCSISGFGNTGLMKDRPGYDVIVQGEAGIQDITGPADGAPYKVGTSIADLVSGLNGSQGILAALYAAKTTGRGQHVSISMYESVASLLSFNASIYYATGESPKRRGNAHATIVPYETFEASDGWISLGVANDELWKRFCKVVERTELTDDPRFAKAADRVRNRDILVPIVKDIIRQRKRDDWLPLMDAAGIPSGAIRTVGEVCESELLKSRDMIAEMPHAGNGVGVVKNIKNPMHLSDTPLDSLRGSAPARRTHGEILTGLLGYSTSEVEELARARRSDGALGHGEAARITRQQRAMAEDRQNRRRRRALPKPWRKPDLANCRRAPDGDGHAGLVESAGDLRKWRFSEVRLKG